MNAVITCGGTGGHIVPALAIADLLKAEYRDARILFVGTEQGMEREMIKEAGYPYRALRLIGLPRKISPRALRAVYLAERALGEAKRILRESHPDIVIGTGGYACYPTVRAATALGIPAALHESNAVPGLAVRLLARRVDRVWLNFEQAGGYFKRKENLLTVGNPLRDRTCLSDPSKQLPHGCRQMVLSFGGSLGAERINDAVLELMKWESQHPEIYHLHATGKRDHERFLARAQAMGVTAKNLEIRAFISDMPRQMAAADAVICRAGAMSISELAMAGKAAVLIPSPNVTGNHQYINAKVLSDKGAALLLEEHELTGAALIERVGALLKNGAKRREMEVRVADFAHPEAGEEILADIRRLIEGRG